MTLSSLRRALIAALSVALIAPLSALPTHAEPAPATQPTSSAQPDKNCTVSVKLPSKIAIDRYYREVKVTLVDPCNLVDYTSTRLYGSRGFENIFIFDGNSTEYWDIYDWHNRGTFKTRETRAYDEDYNKLPVKDGIKTTIKLGTRSTLTSSRSGNKVSLTVRAQSYSPKNESFVKWKDAKATIQFKSGSEWKKLKTVTLVNGQYTLTRSDSKVRQYRVVLHETSSRWDHTSKTTKR